jgi:hypothetical protein
VTQPLNLGLTQSSRAAKSNPGGGLKALLGALGVVGRSEREQRRTRGWHSTVASECIVWDVGIASHPQIAIRLRCQVSIVSKIRYLSPRCSGGQPISGRESCLAC